MLILVVLICLCIYCWYNYMAHDEEEIYGFIGIPSALAICVMIIVAFIGNFESSIKFEAQKELRKYLEYQIDNPAQRDSNFFGQLSLYNSTVVKQQEYNKDWFLMDIYISDKWNTIDPLTLGETE